MKDTETKSKHDVKHLFTEKDLNKLFKKVLKESKRIRGVKENWRTFVINKLRLTEGQKQNLDNIPNDVVQHLQQAFNDVIDNGGDVDVIFGSDIGAKGKSASGEGKLTIKINNTSNSDSGVSLKFTVPIVSCTFDSNCQNWKCNPGPAM